MTNDLPTAAGSGTLHRADAPTAQEEAAAQLKLLHLLAKRTLRYTGGDSGSVPEETAAELLESVRFTLELSRREQHLSESGFARADFDALFADGISLLEAAIGRCRSLWETACLGIPALNNVSLRDTLRSIGAGFSRYDYRYRAHSFPCDIDYQLASPVPETLLGIEYIGEYLRRIITENVFLRCFDAEAEEKLLNVYCPDYKGQLINLYEPIFANALGRVLLGLPPLPLEISAGELARLETALTLPTAKLRALLEAAADRLCAQLQLPMQAHTAYATAAALALCPRIKSALPLGGLGGIFLPL